jgi:hypothetical protein
MPSKRYITHKSGKLSSNIITPRIGNGAAWLEASSRAKKKLQELKQKCSKVRAAIQIFEENAASGVPWPGEDAGAKKKSTPA